MSTGQGRLEQILRSGTMELSDVSPPAIARYLAVLREATPDRRLNTAARQTRGLWGAVVNAAAGEGTPNLEAWRLVASDRYGGLPGKLATMALDPEFVPTLEEHDLARMVSPVGYGLEVSGMRWCLAGTLGSGIFGEPAPVADLEFLVELDGAKLPELTKHLGDLFWWSNAALQEASASPGGTAEVYQLPFFLKVRLHDVRADPLGREALDRRVQIEGSACGRLWVQSPEDVVLRRLVAWRDADEGEEILWRELAMVLAVQGDKLNAAQLDERAKALDVFDTLTEARSQAGVA